MHIDEYKNEINLYIFQKCWLCAIQGCNLFGSITYQNKLGAVQSVFYCKMFRQDGNKNTQLFDVLHLLRWTSIKAASSIYGLSGESEEERVRENDTNLEFILISVAVRLR